MIVPMAHAFHLLGRKAAVLLALALTLVGCRHLVDETDLSEVRFTLSSQSWPAGTRSVLRPSAETTLSSILLAAYRDGRLEVSRTFRAGQPLSLFFSGRGSRTVYALVNMASVQEAELPMLEADLPSLSWRIGSYEEMDRDGLPMAGSVVTDVSAGLCPIPVTRLVSRFEFDLLDRYQSFFSATDRLAGHAADPGYLFKNIRYVLRNINGTLRPFGASIAGPRDLIQDQEFALTEDGNAVLYVPENLQGKLLDSNDPTRKDLPALLQRYGPDYTVCASYVEVMLTHDPSLYGVGGDLTYRFFLGENATDDFSVSRNRIYSVGFGPEYNTVMQCFDTGSWPWKVGSDNWRDTRYLAFGTNQVSARKGSTAQLAIRYGFEGVDHPEFASDWTLLARGAGESDWVSAASHPAFSAVSFDPSRSEVQLALARSYTGSLVNLAARTTDGRHEAMAQVQLLPDGEILIHWNYEPRYIGQVSTLALSREGTPLAISGVSVSEGADRVLVQSTGGIWKVSALRSGAVRLEVTTSDGDAISVPLTFKAPVLQVDTPMLTLPADASDSPRVRFSYRTDETDGNVPLQVAASGQSGPFLLDAALYEQYLRPVVSIVPGRALSAYLALDSDQAYVASYPADPAALLGVTDAEAFRGQARQCPDVLPAAAGAQVPVIFPGWDASGRLGIIRNYSVLGVYGGNANPADDCVNYRGEAVEYTGGPTFTSSVTNWEFENYGQFAFSLSAAGKLVLRPASQTWTAGKVPLAVRIRNARTGAQLRVEAGWMDCYLFTEFGGILRNGAVSADLWGWDRVDAFSSLRQTLRTAAIIRPDFNTGAFVLRSSSGNRVWTLRTEESLEGNYQINYETDANQMSTWTEAKSANATYRLGETVYTINLNPFMTTIYDYSWEALMVWRTTQTYLTCTVSGLTNLIHSDLGWHYAWGTERDANGCSYYVFRENVSYFLDTDVEPEY